MNTDWGRDQKVERTEKNRDRNNPRGKPLFRILFRSKFHSILNLCSSVVKILFAGSRTAQIICAFAKPFPHLIYLTYLTHLTLVALRRAVYLWLEFFAGSVSSFVPFVIFCKFFSLIRVHLCPSVVKSLLNPLLFSCLPFRSFVKPPALC